MEKTGRLALSSRLSQAQKNNGQLSIRDVLTVYIVLPAVLGLVHVREASVGAYRGQGQSKFL